MTGQSWNPGKYERDAGFVSALGRDVVGLLAPRPGERILDLGCGDGRLTMDLAAAGCKVVGVDSSPEFVDAARARGLDVRQMDAQDLDFEGEFDAVFSNAALHWMKDAAGVVGGVSRALVADGRFVAECGGAGNVGRVHKALYAALKARGIDAATVDPWYFPDAEAYRRQLEAAGFRVTNCVLFERPTDLPGTLTDWLEIFAGAFLAALPEADRPVVVKEVSDGLAPALCRRGGADGADLWWVDYVRLRFAAVCP